MAVDRRRNEDGSAYRAGCAPAALAAGGTDGCAAALLAAAGAAGADAGAALAVAFAVRITPPSAALIRLESEPASKAFRPSLAIIGRWLGASPPVTASWIAIELKLAKPQSAKVITATV